MLFYTDISFAKKIFYKPESYIKQIKFKIGAISVLEQTIRFYTTWSYTESPRFTGYDF